jgi:hypothetical protein
MLLSLTTQWRRAVERSTDLLVMIGHFKKCTEQRLPLHPQRQVKMMMITMLKVYLNLNKLGVLRII